MPTITIDYKDWKKGISSADGVEDGGYSPLYGGHQINSHKDGNLYMGPELRPSPTLQDFDDDDYSGAVDYFGHDDRNNLPMIYAKSPTYLSAASGGQYGFLIDDDGNFYRIRFFDEAPFRVTQIDGSDIDAGGSGQWAKYSELNTQDYENHQDDIFVAIGRQVMKIGLTNVGGYESLDSNWWIGTRDHGGLGVYDRKILVTVEDTLYIITENEVHIWDGDTSQENALTLPDNFNATAAIKHINGRDLIIFGKISKSDRHVAAASYVAYIINTVDLEFTREITLSGEVSACFNLDGQIIIISKEWLGTFDGEKITRVYQLNTSISDNPSADGLRQQIRNRHCTLTDHGHLLIPDGRKVLALLSVEDGIKMWHIADGDNQGDSIAARYREHGKVEMVMDFANQDVGYFAFHNDNTDNPDSLQFRYFELDGRSSGHGKWPSNKIRFNSRVVIRKIVVEFEPFTPSDSNDAIRIKHRTTTGEEELLGEISENTHPNVGEAEIMTFVRTTIFQYIHEAYRYTGGLKRATIHYEPDE